MNEERRRHPRVESMNLVSVGRSKEGPVEVGRTLVLSEGGALLEMPEPYSLHTVFDLDLALEDEIVKLQAEVRHVRVTENGVYKIGVRFLDLDPAIQARLEEHLEEKLGEEG